MRMKAEAFEPYTPDIAKKGTSDNPLTGEERTSSIKPPISSRIRRGKELSGQVISIRRGPRVPVEEVSPGMVVGGEEPPTPEDIVAEREEAALEGRETEGGGTEAEDFADYDPELEEQERLKEEEEAEMIKRAGAPVTDIWEETEPENVPIPAGDLERRKPAPEVIKNRRPRIVVAAEKKPSHPLVQRLKGTGWDAGDTWKDYENKRIRTVEALAAEAALKKGETQRKNRKFLEGIVTWWKELG